MLTEIETIINEVDFTIEKAKRNDDYTFCFEKDGIKKYVLSKYNPREDAISLLGGDFGNIQTIWVLLGFGFGYIVEELVKYIGDQVRVIIIEPSEKLLDEQLIGISNKWKVKKENIHFFTGSNFNDLQLLIDEVVLEQEMNNIKIISLEKYLMFYKKYYKKVLEVINEAIELKAINRNTRRLYAGTFVRNTLRNRTYIKNGYDLSIYKNFCKDIPAVIVSGGPSLSKNIQFIKDFKGMIFTGGRTLTPVLEEGIQPDFVVSLDPHDIVVTTLQGNAENELSLITLDNANYKVLEASRGRKYFVRTQAITQDLLGVKLDVSLSLGGSVATLCLSTAHYMGCNPIIFIGQDLAYTDFKYHADICSNEKNGLKTGELLDEQKCKAKGYRQIKGYDNNVVWSEPSLILFLRWIERFIMAEPDRIYINATEGGAFIDGTVNENFEDVVKRYKNVIKPTLKEAQRQPNVNVDVDQNLQDALIILGKAIKLIEDANNLSEKLLREYNDYKGKRYTEIIRLVKKLEKIDDKILKLGDSKNIVVYLFSVAYAAINADTEQKEKINETKIEKDIRIINYNYMVYQTMTKSIIETKQIIEDVLKNEIDKTEKS
ncbi:MAG: hypothetical protein K0S61_1601 [Anaerocolumna sp.]|jgi:hypothetical protein|nr:hypothetical protein [Anaerocolumna sp.]